MYKNIITLLLSTCIISLFSHLALAEPNACNDAHTLDTLQQLESKTLLKNAPTFKHGWQNQSITLNFAAQSSSDPAICEAKMTLTLPQADLDEVNTYFDANPAKRILLAGQGYVLPEVVNHLTYQYALNNQAIVPNDSGNQDLKALHNGVEYMYQLLAQIRIEIKPSTLNTVTWPTDLTQTELELCTQRYLAANTPLSEACNCRVTHLSQVITANQMELIYFITQQPYSAATGVLTSYRDFSEQANQDCHLSKK